MTKLSRFRPNEIRYRPNSQSMTRRTNASTYERYEPRAAAALGSYLSYVEALVLLVMLWLFGRYRISFGRNLLSLVIGYSLWVGIDVIILILLFLPGNGASTGLRRLAPAVYFVTLIVWCVGLWGSEPDPPQPSESIIERDYKVLAAKTRASFA